MGLEYKLYPRNEFGLIPDTMNLLYNCKFFTTTQNENKVFGVSSIVSVEKI